MFKKMVFLAASFIMLFSLSIFEAKAQYDPPCPDDGNGGWG